MNEKSALNTSAQFAQDPLELLSGAGDMGALMRRMDWARTPLGPVDSWPQSLKTSVSICLASRFPIVLYWGPEYVVLYNDAYSQILGAKHPWALGQTCAMCWAEIWDTIAPMLDGVIKTGKATWSDDLLLMLQRFGYPEECYFSFSPSALFRWKPGIVGASSLLLSLKLPTRSSANGDCGLCAISQRVPGLPRVNKMRGRLRQTR